MPDAFSYLLATILADDRPRAKKLLSQNPTSVHATAAKPTLEPAITHWIYIGDTALHTAAAGHRVEIVKLLLAAGADVNAIGKHRHTRPLHCAADGCLQSPRFNPKRQVATLKLLISAGAELDARDKNGATALHRAVRCLLDAGCDTTQRNKPGSTPFHLAVQNTGRGGSGSEKAKAAQRQIIQAFLDRGVSPKLKDAKGKTVLDWAKSDWIREIFSLKGF